VGLEVLFSTKNVAMSIILKAARKKGAKKAFVMEEESGRWRRNINLSQLHNEASAADGNV
jgi:hypothetical protein